MLKLPIFLSLYSIRKQLSTGCELFSARRGFLIIELLVGLALITTFSLIWGYFQAQTVGKQLEADTYMRAITQASTLIERLQSGEVISTGYTQGGFTISLHQKNPVVISSDSSPFFKAVEHDPLITWIEVVVTWFCENKEKKSVSMLTGVPVCDKKS